MTFSHNTSKYQSDHFSSGAQFLNVNSGNVGISDTHRTSTDSAMSFNSFTSSTSNSGIEKYASSPGYSSGNEEKTEIKQFKKKDSNQQLKGIEETGKTLWKRVRLKLVDKTSVSAKKKTKEEPENAEIDPVYHLLKCAANQGSACGNCNHSKDMKNNDTAPCKFCQCPCHNHSIKSTSYKS